MNRRAAILAALDVGELWGAGDGRTTNALGLRRPEAGETPARHGFRFMGREGRVGEVDPVEAGDDRADEQGQEHVSELVALARPPPGRCFVPCLSGCFPNMNLRPFSCYAQQAPVPDVAPGLHAAFPG